MSAGHPTGGAPAPKKTSPWIFVLIGCVGLIVIGGAVMVGVGYFAVSKVKEAGFDPALMKEQPALAAAKMMAAANPDIEVVDVDEDGGRITFRDKKSGKTVTMDADKIQQGELVFESEEGEVFSLKSTDAAASAGEGAGMVEMKTKEGTFQMGAGGKAKLPSWLDEYPGTEPAGVMHQEGPQQIVGAVTFTTSDSVEDVMEFYKKVFEDAGLEVNVVQHSGAAMGAMVTGDSTDKKRSAGAILGPGEGGSGTSGNLTYREAK
jgi:hypothetical protein